jgi:hypothetical protein
MNEVMTLTIGKDEALVLFDFLWEFRDQATLPIPDNSQRAAFWSLQSTLEKHLLEPFLPENAQLLEEAKKRLTLFYGLVP